MGQKINPTSYRIGINEPWRSRWYFAANAVKQFKSGNKSSRTVYAKLLEEDEAIRKIVRAKLVLAGLASIEIERTAGSLRVYIKAAKPGIIIGRGGKGVEELNKAIEKAIQKVRADKGPVKMSINIEELKRSEISSTYVAQQIAWDLERRMPFRRTIKKHLDLVMQNKEVKGAKILASGRLDGNEISRRESLKSGALPLQTLRAKIDYGRGTAFCSYGTIGLKVWIYKGQVFSRRAIHPTDAKRPPANSK
ncbi:MAG: 30S ribosomal protein S3 [bacterium]|nr:30S ribosomal protein S3 [bacterium]